MPTMLQLQKAKAEAAVKVDAAQKKVAAATTDGERATATAELGAALGEKIQVNEAMLALMSGQPAAGVTTVKHIKHEEKVTEREEDSEEEEEAKPPMRERYEEERKGKRAEKDPPEDDDGDDEKSSTDMGAEKAEEEEESKAIVAEYARASAAVGKVGPNASLYSPERLLRAVKEATGAKTLKGAFGALSSFGARVQATGKLEARLASLEAEAKTAKVDALIERGKKEGKIVGKVHADRLRADGMQHGADWLRGHLAAAPRVAVNEPLSPKIDANGNPAADVSPEVERIIADGIVGLAPADAAAARATILAQHAKTMNGAAKRPSH